MTAAEFHSDVQTSREFQKFNIHIQNLNTSILVLNETLTNLILVVYQNFELLLLNALKILEKNIYYCGLIKA